MKHWIKFLVRLYPSAWRERYGVEFAALLEDTDPNWRTLVDLLKGAFDMQLRSGRFLRIAALTVPLCALAAFAASFAVPRQYASSTALRVIPLDGKDAVSHVRSLSQQVITRTGLTRIIVTFGLYRAELAKMPIEDVLEKMNRQISIAPIADQNANVTGFRVEFVYDDPATAQKVTQALVSRLIDVNTEIHFKDREGGANLELVSPAALPTNPVFPNRWLFVGTGLAVGSAIGALLAWLRRAPKLAS